MKTFKTYIDEAKKWPGGEASAKNWQKISKARHDRIIAQHDPIGPDLPGYASKPGRIHVNKFDDGSHGTQRWSPNKKHVPSVYKVTHKDGEITHWMKRDGLYEMTEVKKSAEKPVTLVAYRRIEKNKNGKDVYIHGVEVNGKKHMESKKRSEAQNAFSELDRQHKAAGKKRHWGTRDWYGTKFTGKNEFSSIHEGIDSDGFLSEMTDAEIDAHNDKFEKNVVDAHLKHIHKKYGKDVDCNFGSGATDSQFTSKVFHPKKGTIRVTTHFHPETLKVEKHTEE